MLNSLNKLRERRENGEDGFTLIELLVVVVIIGILIAIAIPLYLNYKKGANDKAAQSDLRGAISTLETCATDNNGSYPAAFTFTSGKATPCTNQTINLSDGTTMNYYVAADNSSYTLLTTNSKGNATGGTSGYYCYASQAGGSVVKKSGTQPTSNQTAC